MRAPFWLRNLPHRARGWRAELLHFTGLGGCLAELEVTILRADGRVEHLGVVSRRVVTNNGVAYLADCFMNTAEPEAVNYHDAGTGTNGELAADSALQTPYGGARAVGTQSKPASNQYKSVGIVAFTGPLAITEHGIFTAAAAGTLWDRSVFAALNVVNLDSIQFSYTLTLTAGG